MSKIRFQSAKVVDVVDKDPFNLDATVIADLCEEGSIPESRYDCCIFSGVAPPCGDRGLGNLWRALAPGGVMLLAIDRRELPESGLDRIFPAGKAQVVAARGDYLLARVFKRGT